MSAPTTVADAQRDDPDLTPADLISAYEQGVLELQLAIAGMTVEQLRSRPVAGRWSTLEVVCPWQPEEKDLVVTRLTYHAPTAERRRIA